VKHALFLSFLCLILASCAQITILRTQELVEVQNRVDSLRSQIRSFEQNWRIRHEEGVMSDLQHRVAVEIALDRLNEMLMQLSGNLNENQLRISEITRATDMISLQMAERARRDSLFAAIKEQERLDLFNLGRTNFDRGNFSLALNDFKDYMDKYPDCEEFSNALYWKAESYFALDSLEMANTLFQQYYKDNRDGKFACTVLYKIGLIFDRLGQTRNKDSVWNQLKRQCPESEETRLVEGNQTTR